MNNKVKEILEDDIDQIVVGGSTAYPGRKMYETECMNCGGITLIPFPPGKYPIMCEECWNIMNHG